MILRIWALNVPKCSPTKCVIEEACLINPLERSPATQAHIRTALAATADTAPSMPTSDRAFLERNRLYVTGLWARKPQEGQTVARDGDSAPERLAVSRPSRISTPTGEVVQDEASIPYL